MGAEVAEDPDETAAPPVVGVGWEGGAGVVGGTPASVDVDAVAPVTARSSRREVAASSLDDLLSIIDLI
jgi:hypothetical protein